MTKYPEDVKTIQKVEEAHADYGIPEAVSNIWKAIQSLSPSNKQWLTEHLIEQVEEENIGFISDEELAACLTVDEVENQLLDMVRNHFSSVKAI